MPKKYVLKRKILETQIRCLKDVKILKTFKLINPRESVPVTQHPPSVPVSLPVFAYQGEKTHIPSVLMFWTQYFFIAQIL